MDVRRKRDQRADRLTSRANDAFIHVAVRVGFSREYIARSERPTRGLPSANLINALDHALGAGGALIDAHADAQRRQQERRRPGDGSPRLEVADAQLTFGRAGSMSPAI